MPEYLVTWEIEVDADSPSEAVRQAHEMAQEPTTATVYEVRQRRADTGQYAEAYRTIDIADTPRGGSRADGPLLGFEPTIEAEAWADVVARFNQMLAEHKSDAKTVAVLDGLFDEWGSRIEHHSSRRGGE